MCKARPSLLSVLHENGKSLKTQKFLQRDFKIYNNPLLHFLLHGETTTAWLWSKLKTIFLVLLM
jgi:hypothetical protein